MTDSPDRPQRSFVWLWLLFGLGVVLTPVLVVMASLHRTDEEQPFVGTWVVVIDGEPLGEITFDADGRGRSEWVEAFRWSVEGDEFTAFDPDPGWFDYLRHRLLGTELEGELMRVDSVATGRITLTNAELPDSPATLIRAGEGSP